MTFNPLSDKRRGLAYVADPLGRLGQGSWVRKGDPFGRILPEKKDRHSFDFSRPLKISSAVGMTDGGLETAKKYQPDLSHVTKPEDLNNRQLVKAQIGYMESAMRKSVVYRKIMPR